VRITARRALYEAGKEIGYVFDFIFSSEAIF